MVGLADNRTAVATGAACACCGTRSASRRYIAEADGYCCEACLLDRRLPAPTAAATEQLYARFVEALTETLDLREHETGLHSRRVACHTQVLARRLVAEPAALRQIYWGALLHDIGKIGVPDAILLKEDRLSDAEWTVMRSHVDCGWQIVARLPEMTAAAELVRCHEERFDGGGYPRGLKGDEIALGARLFAVIDTLDAMTSDRSYRKALPFDAAQREIVRLAGTQFDPLAVDAFLAEEATLREMVTLKCSAVALPGGAP
ncbi:HD-GYP domain-containing protein [Azospira restricta]|uniref:HD domain-containing protein n=2 Tax=Azospira restricta TaxID=404405 RepID=A0A974SST7_9RHOO|nr:HD domain-containing protein [Azospira restricta]